MKQQSNSFAHGIYKGSGFHTSSASKKPPSFVAVAALWERSIGKILNVNFKFAMERDQHIDQIPTLLDPNEDEFAVSLPYHTGEINAIQLFFMQI